VLSSSLLHSLTPSCVLYHRCMGNRGRQQLQTYMVRQSDSACGGWQGKHLSCGDLFRLQELSDIFDRLQL
jgi:hypothetical protein